ncbi:MAG: B12-binding domain-containing radical SAM protein [Firmicutes bacterium]|nr:B12-binding domain-containing radical SAM protein [Bacillota bacterium]
MKAGDFAKKSPGAGANGLDAIFIHIDSFYNIQYSYFNMGLLYMATILSKEGYRVRCMGVGDILWLSREKTERLFRVTKPAIAGFYTLSDNIYQVQEFASRIKKYSPATRTVVGGPLATSLGEKILDYKDFDMCIVGEGEIPIKMLADFLVKSEGKLGEIPGLIYRYNGNILKNPPAPPIPDLDALPYPDYEMVNTQYSFHVVSGRGCPYNCIFCFQGVHGLKYRYRDADKIIDEIRGNLEKYHAVTFDIIDDTFISNPQRVGIIADKLIQYRQETGRDFRFFCQGRVDIMDKHPEMVQKLQKAGLCRVQVGIESGSPDTLEMYRKRIKPEQIVRVARQVADAGEMVMAGNFILGGPFENEKTFRASVELGKQLVEAAPGAFEMGSAYLGPYPGTDIAENPGKYGLKVYDDKFMKGLTLSDCHLTSDSFGVNEIRRLGPRFADEMYAAMEKQLPNIPRKLVETHFEWARKFKLFSLYYLNFFAKREALADYFNNAMNPRFKKLGEIPDADFADFFAMRTTEPRKYTEDGKALILPLTIQEQSLTDPAEILIYELSSGKLTIGRMAEEFAAETECNLSKHEIIENIFKPFFRKMEEGYQVIFY